MKNNLTLKRVIAYFIDSIVIAIFSSAFSYLTFLNPTYEEYSKVNDEYVKYVEYYYKKVGDNVCDINCDTNNDFIADENIKEINVNQLKYEVSSINIDTNNDNIIDLNIDVNNDLNPDFNIDTNDDFIADENLINQDLNDDQVCDLNCDLNNDNIPDLNIDMDNDKTADLNIDSIIDLEFLSNKSQELSYKMNKFGYVYIIFNMIVALLYFGFFAFITKGQTLGKKLLKIKITTTNNQEPKIYQYIIRLFILNSFISSILTLIAICFKESTYEIIYKIGSSIDNIIIIIIFLMACFYKEGRGIHDILAGTKVIDLKAQDNEPNEVEVITPQTKEE